MYSRCEKQKGEGGGQNRDKKMSMRHTHKQCMHATNRTVHCPATQAAGIGTQQPVKFHFGKGWDVEVAVYMGTARVTKSPLLMSCIHARALTHIHVPSKDRLVILSIFYHLLFNCQQQCIDLHLHKSKTNTKVMDGWLHHHHSAPNHCIPAAPSDHSVYYCHHWKTSCFMILSRN